MEPQIDEKDVAILRVLDENARLSYRELAKKLGMHPNTVMERVKRMEVSGVIERYAPIVNYRKLGYKIIAIIQVDIEGKPTTTLRNIAKLGFVHYAYHTSGEYDGIIVVIAKDVDELSKMLNEISGVSGVQSINAKIALEQFGGNGRFGL